MHLDDQGNEAEALFDGVPDHLLRPLRAWLGSYLENQDYLVDRVALQLRLSLESGTASDLIKVMGDRGPDTLLRAVNLALNADLQLRWEVDVEGPEDNRYEASLADWIPEFTWSRNGRARSVEQLDQILVDAGSAFEFDWKEFRLHRRVEPTVQAAAHEVIRQAPGTHLSKAWGAVYGQHPDPTMAYDEAIRAVEAAAIPRIIPSDRVGTLGKVLSHLRDSAGNWELAIEGKNDGDIAPVVAMIELLWHGHVARHPGGPNSRPQRLDEAEMSVHLAATLVQWLISGALRRR
ncbi:MAG TPA: hypothetical protein VGN37_20615 [Actinocatenispora sp.]